MLRDPTRTRGLRRRLFGTALLVSVALTAVACGEDGPTDTGPTLATVSGAITDHPGDLGIAGATVTGTATGSELFSVATDASGAYTATFEVADPPSQLAITVTADKFVSGDSAAAFAEDVTLDLQLTWGSPFTQDCLGVDPGNVTIQESGGTYYVVDGSSSLMAFPELSEAQAARDLIQFYGFNDMCFVGRPDPGMMYWLVDDGPMPEDAGSPVTEDCIAVDPTNVTVEGSGSTYYVMDGSSSLMAFPELSEAEAARDLVQFYELANQCFVGRPDADMMYWLR